MYSCGNLEIMNTKSPKQHSFWAAKNWELSKIITEMNWEMVIVNTVEDVPVDIFCKKIFCSRNTFESELLWSHNVRILVLGMARLECVLANPTQPWQLVYDPEIRDVPVSWCIINRFCCCFKDTNPPIIYLKLICFF